MNEEQLNAMLVGREIKAVKVDGEDALNIALDDGLELIIYTDGPRLCYEVAS